MTIPDKVKVQATDGGLVTLRFTDNEGDEIALMLFGWQVAQIVDEVGDYLAKRDEQRALDAIEKHARFEDEWTGEDDGELHVVLTVREDRRGGLVA